jgi:RNA polymerase sigma factor (sigma-70 family)
VTPRRAAPEADATRDLYERYARQIYTYCLHQLGNREEAEDAVQSTFLNAFRGYQRGVDPEFESAWLYKIAQNVCLTRQRSSSRRRRVETSSDLDAMQDYVPAHEFDADELINLPEALDAMPHQQRKALLLREWQGLSYKEIAEELDLSQAAVETLLFRARRTLAAGLSDEPATKSTLRRLRTGGDAGSTVAILKSLLFTGGAKVATAVATVAATSVVAAAPTARHAVEDVVTPGHDRASAPAHHIARTPGPGGAPASSRVVASSRFVSAAAAATPVVMKKSPAAHAPRAHKVSALRAHSRAHAPAATPAAQQPAPVDTAGPAPSAPADPVAAVPVDEPAASAPALSAQAPAAAQPAPAPAPEKTKGEDKKNDANEPSSPPPAKKNDPASGGNNGKNGDKGRITTSTTTTPVAAPPASAPAADSAPQNNGNGRGNGKNGDKGKGNNTQVDVPAVPAVVATPTTTTTTTSASTPSPPPATTTTTATTTSAAPTPAPPAVPQPTVTTEQATPPSDNGKGNGGNNGNGQGHRK